MMAFIVRSICGLSYDTTKPRYFPYLAILMPLRSGRSSVFAAMIIDLFIFILRSAKRSVCSSSIRLACRLVSLSSHITISSAKAKSFRCWVRFHIVSLVRKVSSM